MIDGLMIIIPSIGYSQCFKNGAKKKKKKVIKEYIKDESSSLTPNWSEQ